MNPLDQMLRAGSVAVVGASAHQGSVGEQTLRQLVEGGFDGIVYPVNPGYDSLLGMACYPDIGAIAEPVDLAVLAVGNANLESAAESALHAGARSLAIFASCHGTAADGSPLRQRITTLANEAGTPICGGNGMGFVNVEHSLRVCGFYQPEDLTPGGIAFLSHSGSLFSAMLHNGRGLEFNLVVSTGLELNTRMSDYLSWVLGLESTRVVALFMETIRDPDGFVKALARAEDRGIPIVALKVGVSTRGRQAVATHSEAIAGDDAVYEALFDAYGVHRVLTMDEMADTVELLASGRRPVAGGLGAVHDSGGERALLIDTADRVGVLLPELSPSTVNTLTGLLDPGLEAENPVDAWGTGRGAREVFVGCLDALAFDPAIGAVAFCVDLTAEEESGEAYGIAAIEAAAHSEKPIAVLANLSTTVDQTQAAMVRAAGIPVLHGTETGLRAIRHLLDRADRLHWPVPSPRFTEPKPIDSIDAFSLLDRYSISVAATLVASDIGGVLDAAESIGYPVVLKTMATAHKSDVGGVVVDVPDRSQLEAAYAEISVRLGPDVTVSEQISKGVEIGLGMITDPQFGPVVIVSAGGTLIEVLRDRIALLPPVDVFRARKAIAGLDVSRVLEGTRGSPPADIDALAEVIARFSELAVDSTGVISSIDLNPVIVGREGAVAVDVLMKPAVL
jgi:acetate---CoA ligase (ADP-forming)